MPDARRTFGVGRCHHPRVHALPPHWEPAPSATKRDRPGCVAPFTLRMPSSPAFGCPSAPFRTFFSPCNCGCLAVWRSPLGGAFVCSLLAVALQVRPVPLCPLAPHTAPQTAAASSGPLVPICVRLRCCCAWLWLVGGPLRGASSARCWQWPCRCERRLSARSLCAKHRRRRPRRPARSCPSACCGGGAAAASPLGVGPLAFSVSSRPR